jgi:hypothetical protein
MYVMINLNDRKPSDLQDIDIMTFVLCLQQNFCTNRVSQIDVNYITIKAVMTQYF